MRNRKIRDLIPVSKLGGMANARLSLRETVQLMDDAISGRLPEMEQPLFMTSSNGQVLSMYARSSKIRRLFDQADVISADGQPMVTISRLLTSKPVPDRTSTTDLFEDASLLLPEGTSYYLFGTTPEEIERAAISVRRRFPRVRLLGYSHGYLDQAGEEALFDELDRLQPDILWIGLGVPREQEFVLRNIERLKSVKVVKTSGGLFNFLSGSRSRAPVWMQKAGLEWLYRTVLEPRRLAMRYLITNPHSLYLLLTRTG